MRLKTPLKVGKLQNTLHAKAKESPDFRFYSLYDKIHRADILEFAYRLCRANKGVAGVDGQTFADIDAYGIERWLGELEETLKTKTYHPQPVKRVFIPKENGGERPLGIPTIKDRVVQMAAVLVFEPIVAADLQDEQYAYRPNRSALDAVRRVHSLVNTGHTEIIDADLSGYFDTIPHAELMKSVARRISDGRVLRLIKMWLQAPVDEIDNRGRRTRTTRNRDEGRGTPQGSPFSPLLSSLYMRRFILGWKTLGHEQRLQARIVNYADDFVICCRGTADEAMTVMRRMMDRLKLTVNEKKTTQCRLPAESFEFLGYRIGRCYSPRTGKAYLGTKPSPGKVTRLCRKISEVTDRKRALLDVEQIVGELNRMLVGWSNYFCLGPVSKAYAAVDSHVSRRLRQWLCVKHKVPGRGASRFPDDHLYEKLKVVQLRRKTHHFPWATA